LATRVIKKIMTRVAYFLPGSSHDFPVERYGFYSLSLQRYLKQARLAQKRRK